jgi:hypothetical protein
MIGITAGFQDLAEETEHSLKTAVSRIFSGKALIKFVSPQPWNHWRNVDG